ncbi:MAG: hypothetical protein JNK66_05340 [Chitinophagales bacterium]|nr:hypothetical protein [Chitinophagales bacterium]
MQEKTRYDLLFGMLLIAATMFTLPWHQGFLLGDDYLGAAHQLLNGNWDIHNNFWANRVGAYLPYSVGIWLGGFGLWLNFITTAEFVVLLGFVYWVLRKFNLPLAFVVCCFLAFCSLLHQCAAVTQGDILTTFTANATVLLYFLFATGNNEQPKKQKWWGLVTSSCFFYSLLVKESVVFFMPVLLWYFIADVRQKKAKDYWLYFGAGSAVLVGLLMLAYWIKTGDPLYRLHIVEAQPSSSDSNYAGHNKWLLFSRLTWQPLKFLIENFSFGCFLFLSLPQLILVKRDSPFEERFFAVFQLLGLSFWWVGSQGFSTYNPVALVPRLWLPLVIPMAINSAYFILKLLRQEVPANQKNILAFTVLLLLLASACFLYKTYVEYTSLGISPPNISSLLMWYTAYSMFILLSFYGDKLLSILPRFSEMAFVFFVFPLFSGSVLGFANLLSDKVTGKKNGFETEREMFEYVVSLNPKRIITDYRVTHFYYAYVMDMDKQLPVFDYNTIPIDSVKPGDLLLLNPERQEWFQKNITVTLTYTKANYDIAPYSLTPEQYGFEKLKQNESNILYRFAGN